MDKKISNKKGFTLIELLVVVSIISVLTSIALAQLGKARDRAHNSYTITTIRQYLTAFELAKDNNTGMLPFSIPEAGSEYCLGAPVNNTCSYLTTDAIPNYNDFNNFIDPYFKGTPSPNPVKNQSDFSPGALLFAYNYTYPNEIDQLELYWSMAGPSDSCVIPGAYPLVSVFDSPNGYFCFLTINFN